MKTIKGTAKAFCAIALIATTQGCAHKTVVVDRPYQRDKAGTPYNELMRAGYMQPHLAADSWPDLAVDISYKPVDGGDWILASIPVSPSDDDHIQASNGPLTLWAKATWHGGNERDATGKTINGEVSVDASFDNHWAISQNQRSQGNPHDYTLSSMDTARTTRRFLVEANATIGKMKTSDKPRVFCERNIMINGKLWSVKMAVRPAQGLVSRAFMQPSTDITSSETMLGTALPDESAEGLSSVVQGGNISSAREKSNFHDPVRPSRGGFGPID